MYVQLVLAMPVLTFILPSATTRSGILVHIYEEVFGQARVAPGAGIVKAVMLALSSINRLASTALLTGGITPVMAAAIIGGMSWTGWLALLAVPYYALLALGAVMTWALHRRGFAAVLDRAEHRPPKPLSGAEWRTFAVVAGTGLLWLTDAWHHLDPTLPAMLALVALLTPGFGTLTWSDLDRHVGWGNFFVIGASISLAHALGESGAAAWLARGLVGGLPGMGRHPARLGGAPHARRHRPARRHSQYLGLPRARLAHRDVGGPRGGLEPPGVRARRDDDGRRRPVLSGAERLRAGHLRARPRLGRRDAALRALDDGGGLRGDPARGAALLELPGRALDDDDDTRGEMIG
jgi:hypothetical protein